MAIRGWVWEPSAVCWQSYVESPSRFAPSGTPERQSLCESHRQRRWLTYWSYCWRIQKCRNLCIPHAFFEGKKAGETSPRKSTPRTLKEVGQQYPPVISTHAAQPHPGPRLRTETQSINQRR